MSGNVRWGTSSWTYEGWQGLVYEDVGRYGKSFKRDSLAEFARDPRFSAVGVDSTFYRPPSRPTLTHYASMLPPGFRAYFKAWQHLTAPTFTRHFGPKDKVGQPNPLFLDPRVMESDILDPIRESFADHVGAVMLEFPLIPPRALRPELFFERLDTFLGALRGDVPLAVEIRSQWWLSPAYFEVLRKHRVAHCFNVWTRMPLPDVVMRKFPESLHTTDFTVCRALVAPGTQYADAVRRFQPYDEIKVAQPAARKALLALAKGATVGGVDLAILVNNRLEGSAPLTVEQLQLELERSQAAESGA